MLGIGYAQSMFFKTLKSLYDSFLMICASIFFQRERICCSFFQYLPIRGPQALGCQIKGNSLRFIRVQVARLGGKP